MKTPREILLEQHRSTTPKLDAIRREAVKVAADVNRRKQPVRELTFAATLANAIRLSFLELVWPCRRIWAGLATAWVLIFIVNFSQRDNMSSVTGKTVRSGEMIMSLQAQQRWMNELFADRLPPSDADRPRNFVPKPRTEKFPNATV
jgi:hypothetical protein